MFKKKENGTAIVAERRPRKKVKPWKVAAILVVVLLIGYFVVGSMTGGSGKCFPPLPRRRW